MKLPWWMKVDPLRIEGRNMIVRVRISRVYMIALLGWAYATAFVRRVRGDK